MKNIPELFEKWEIGNHSGQNRAHGRVTVEPDWMLNLSDKVVGNSKRGPFRWYQRADNSQVEVEVPNIKTIDIDRSIDTDAATCNITIHNTTIEYDLPSGYLPVEFGEPGYFSWNRGDSSEARTRWGQVQNDFAQVLIPDALLRTYQGYGGFEADGSPKSIEDCVEEGSLTLTGVWMIDDVSASTNGSLSIKCRDMAKLLLDQQIFLPFIPQDCYPLTYYRWTYTQFDSDFLPRPPIVTGSVQERPLAYFSSSADAWYGNNASIHGHRGTDSVDSNLDTYALSVGNSHPSRPFCTDYFEYTVNGQMNQFYMHPWGGNYQMFVSILENGVWVDGGGGLIPYDPSDLYATQDTVDTGANIPFVYQTGTPWEQGRWYTLPRVYNAQRIRITFRNHTQSPWGPWYYRCGIREIRAKVDTSTVIVNPVPWCYDMAQCVDPEDPSVDGYWVVDDTGVVFAFGDADLYPANPDWLQKVKGNDMTVIAMAPQPDGHGYWTMQIDGMVRAFGSAEHFGDFEETRMGGERNYIDIVPTNTGEGYYLLQRDGTVHAFGDAVHYGDMPNLGTSGIPEISYRAVAMETHPTLDGYWIVNGDGKVRAFGDLVSLGEIPNRDRMINAQEGAVDITRNEAGDGYWILAGASHVYPFGACEGFGEILQTTFDPNTFEGFQQITWAIVPANHGAGYQLLQAIGTVSTFGNANNFGWPGGGGTKRDPGNYKDYTDIIRELLLWSGFWLYKENPPAGVPPEVYGNLETTGSWSDTGPPDDLFDKHPPIDAIHKIKEAVGYVFYIDDEGAARFESPNWWSIGNFYNDGTHTDFIPEIDERAVLLDYAATYSDASARSEIIISTDAPDEKTGNFVTKTTRFTPDTAEILRGMVKPAMWVNGAFTNIDEQRIMAELIGLHIWFQTRVGNTTMVANPCLQIGDQVRIWERQTAESYVHFIRGFSTSMDLDTGVYTQTLTTNWLGDETSWVITAEDIPHSGDGFRNFKGTKISPELVEWIGRLEGGTTTTIRRSGPFDPTGVAPTFITVDEPIPDEDPGAANG